jgi:protein tyrosine phosphatase (PTP) superfamily phosphohydrolase (DUF442 family)
VQDILNYHQITPRIATSGQPTVAQFQQIAEAGYQVVVNLALTTSSNAIANEDAVVIAQGMQYLHLPVSWERPSVSDFLLFVQLLTVLAEQKLWIHCAKNMRVSCFIYLYQKHLLKQPEAQARYPMSILWQPEGAWAQLVADVDQYYSPK